MNNKLKGNSVSTGIAIGTIYKYAPFTPKVEEVFFESSQKQYQLGEYESAKLRACKELEELYNRMAEHDSKKADIFKAHQVILEDEVMDGEIVKGIKNALMMPDYAVSSVYDSYISMLGQSEDSFIRERTSDLQDVKNRLIRNIYRLEEKSVSFLSEPSIVIAENLLPSDAATLGPLVVGIATEKGGSTSHTAIIARSYGIPAVLGIQGLLDAVEGGSQGILDAIAGELIVQPDKEVGLIYKKKREDFYKEQQYNKQFAHVKAITKDGVEIELGINIESDKLPELTHDCDGIGLFRTEFLYMNSSHMPKEEEQYNCYQSILNAMGSRPVILRTLDIGGDKALEYLPRVHEENPFLGNRAIRFCFDRPDVFETQLRAALRASVHGELWIMFPMIGSLEDWRRAKAQLERVRIQLDQEGVAYSSNVKVGIMIETPSAAVFSDKLAKEVDFASIGTNDLCQYLFAADRMNPNVAGYYQEFSPILFRTLAHIISAFQKEDKPISICGELGGNPLATAILIGLGLRKLSMGHSSLSQVRRVITEVDSRQAATLAEKVLSLDTEAEVKRVMKDFA